MEKILQKYFIGDTDQLDWGYIMSMPEFQALEKCEQSPKWHAEGNVLNHTKLAIDHAYKKFTIPGYWTMEFKRIVLISILFHDIGKPKTYTENAKGIHNFGHEKRSEEMVREILKDEPECDEIATYVGLHMEMHKMITHKDYMERIARLSYDIDLNKLLFVHECDVYGSRCELPEMKEDDIRRFEFLKKIIRLLDGKFSKEEKGFIFREQGQR